MTNYRIQTPQEVAHLVGANIGLELASRGRDMEWLAESIGVSAHSILRATTEGMPVGLLYDVAEVLGVDPARLTRKRKRANG